MSRTERWRAVDVAVWASVGVVGALLVAAGAASHDPVTGALGVAVMAVGMVTAASRL